MDRVFLTRNDGCLILNTMAKLVRSVEHGFTLIELLVVISIIGILIALSLFGISGAREASRDAKRKGDMELIRSGLEIYRADCNDYPSTTQVVKDTPLVGDDTPASCAASNTYISSVPKDPLDTARIYRYARLTPTTYELCAALEQGGTAVTCGGSSNCGTGVTCNDKVTNP